jgi:hypothetical protein
VGEYSGVVQGFCWLRGTAPQIDGSFEEIEGSGSSAEYILQGADVGCYIGFAVVHMQGNKLVSFLAELSFPAHHAKRLAVGGDAGAALRRRRDGPSGGVLAEDRGSPD